MRRLASNLPLRTKFLLSIVLIISGLSCATLLMVWRTVEAEVRRAVEQDLHNSLLTFRNLEAQHDRALGREADLMATLPTLKALMTTEDPVTIQDASTQIWQSSDFDLMALANRRRKIVALHTRVPAFPTNVAEDMLQRSLQQGDAARWWFAGGRLYQVALQPIYFGSPSSGSQLGLLVAGREIDPSAAQDVSRVASSQVVFSYGDAVVASTLPPLEEEQLRSQLANPALPAQIVLGRERFVASSMELIPGTFPSVRITMLRSYDEATAFLSHLNHVLLGLAILGALAGGFLVFLISHTFTRPLGDLVAGVRALEQGDFGYPLESQGGDEVAEVTGAFDRMRQTLQKNEAQRQSLEEQLRQLQKMEAIGRLAGGVAHDFNNLLTVIKGHGDLLLDRLNPGDALLNSAEQILRAADRAASLTRQLLAFSRMQVLQPRVLDLNALVADMSKMLPRLIHEDIEVLVRPGTRLGRVKADPSQIEQVILNLAVNARDAMPQGGQLTIETSNALLDEEYARAHRPIEPGDYVRLTVSDTGHGMDAATKARVFEPFFTTKDPGQGTGLGLSTVYGVVKQSGGFIWLETELGKGARFDIYLPRVFEAVETAPGSAPLEKPETGLGTILLAEDEDAVRELACEFLTSAGYKVLAAADGLAALEIATRRSEPIEVLVSDLVMPRMRGPELAQRLKFLLPQLKIVFMSGYLEYKAGSELGFAAGFLQKPFSREGLVRVVRQVLLGNFSSADAGDVPQPIARVPGI